LIPHRDVVSTRDAILPWPGVPGPFQTWWKLIRTTGWPALSWPKNRIDLELF
jgi:hypothetical protein